MTDFYTENTPCTSEGTKNLIMTKLLISLTTIFLASTLYAQNQTPPQRPQGGKGFGPGQNVIMMDTNKDGKVSKEEMLSWFDKMDTNKDGVLSKEELRAARPSGSPSVNRGLRNYQKPHNESAEK